MGDILHRRRVILSSRVRMQVRATWLPRLWMVCCAGWLGRSLPGWRRIASDLGATVAIRRVLGVAWLELSVPPTPAETAE